MSPSFTRFIAIASSITGAGIVLGLILSRVVFDPKGTPLPGLAFNLGSIDYHVQSYVLILLTGTLVFLFWLAPKLAKNEEPWFLKLIIAAFFMKIAVSEFRLFWIWGVKGGADTRLYFGTGTYFAPQIRNLDFSFVPGLANLGTDFAELYATFVIALIGPTLPGSFLFYAFVSFSAAIIYYKAFVLAFPNGNRKMLRRVWQI